MLSSYGESKIVEKDLLFGHINLGLLFVVEPCHHFVENLLGDRASQERVFKGISTFAKKKKNSSSGLILYLLSSFLVTSICRSLKENCLPTFLRCSYINYSICWLRGGGGNVWTMIEQMLCCSLQRLCSLMNLELF